MIYFNRILKPLYALTFDLDNTLYNNNPVISRAEHESLLFLQKYHPALCRLRWKDYETSRYGLRRLEPDIYHNVTNWRRRSIELVLLNAGLSSNEASSGADDAMEVVMYWRNKINIAPITHITLAALSAKWPLIAITNGNANLSLCGLDGYFYYVLRSGVDGRAKPFKDMYSLASRRLGFSYKNILHVGDDLEADINGAMNCGMQACWINEHVGNCYYNGYIRREKFLPHIEVSHLSLLTRLL